MTAAFARARRPDQNLMAWSVISEDLAFKLAEHRALGSEQIRGLHISKLCPRVFAERCRSPPALKANRGGRERCGEH